LSRPSSGADPTSRLTVNGKTFNATVKKLTQTQELEALRLAPSNGADDMFFKLNGDTYVATGRGLPIDRVKKGAAVGYADQTGYVLNTDRELNTFNEGMRHPLGLTIGGGLTAYGLIGFVQGVLAGQNMAGLGLLIAAMGPVVGALTNLVPAIYGSSRRVDDR